MVPKEDSHSFSFVEGKTAGQKIQILDAAGLFSKQRAQHVQQLSTALSSNGFSVVHHPAQMSAKDALRDDLLLDAYKVVLIYEPAQTAIAYLLATGTSPSAALAEWVKTTRALILLWRKHRRDILLVPATGLQGDQSDLAAAMGARLGGKVIDLPQAASAASVGAVLYLVLAQQTLANHLDARHLVGELEAGGLCPSAIPCDVDQAFWEIAQKADLLEAMEKQQDDLNGDFLRVQTEVTHLQQHLEEQQNLEEEHQQQRGTDRAKGSVQQGVLECELEEVRARYTLMQHHLDSAQSALEEAVLQPRVQPAHPHDFERELLEQSRKFHGVQIELEALAQRHIKDKDLLEQSARDIVGAHTEIASLQDALQQRTTEIHELRESSSWKMTSPIRFAKDTVTGRGKKKE